MIEKSRWIDPFRAMELIKDIQDYSKRAHFLDILRFWEVGMAPKN